MAVKKNAMMFLATVIGLMNRNVDILIKCVDIIGICVDKQEKCVDIWGICVDK